jgi:hypothetical protein
MTPAQIARIREEDAVALARFWGRCDQLAAAIVSYPARPISGRQ